MASAPVTGRTSIVGAVEEAGVVAVIRMKEAAKVAAVIDALAAGGVRVLEITMTVPGAIEVIRSVSSALPDGVILGAGTVLDADTARRVIDAGARFVVAPTFDPDTIRACHECDVPAMPGCFSPTEILRAWQLGADIVKVFPATSLGPGFIKDVRAPLSDIKLMPTGGVTPDNAGDWIKAGAVAVGIGSSLVDAKAVAAGDFARIEDTARLLISNVRAAQASR
ncbi:MAG: bifunctional 4-hydroxy-2-oxoglutarate aldolase/2-dehydro-3-deoxy-phosphogluconate aldolase [Acidobacteriota bacterium]|nr:bifunctional 4-hydroxy-2-oxoglutarate aldolase/2-dehydro-3-deoxy-phosphogluconate aldolase [Acidobacteriota bacterium]